jgi:hypothetical protein
MKNKSYIYSLLLIGISISVSITSISSAQTRVYSAFCINITNVAALPENNSLTGEYLVGLIVPQGKTPFYGSIVARKGTAANTFQLGIRATMMNDALFYSADLSTGEGYRVALSAERGEDKNTLLIKYWFNPEFHLPEPLPLLVQTGDVFPFDVNKVVVRISSKSPAPAIITDAQTSPEWGVMAMPVELVSFAATMKRYGVELTWRTATEVNNYGFEIQRKSSSLVSARDDKWTKVGFVEGAGNSNAPKEYSFVDNASASGTYAYRLKQIDRDGRFEYSDQIEITVSQMPQKFLLMQNYPNPFNPATTIRFAVPVSGFVSLKVYDALGKEIATVVHEVKDAGEHAAQFNASALPSGTYFYTLRSGNSVETKKMMLLK